MYQKVFVKVLCSMSPTLACVAAGPRTRLNHLYSHRRFRVSATQATPTQGVDTFCD